MVALCGAVRDSARATLYATPPDRPPVIEVAVPGLRQARVRCWSGVAVPARPGRGRNRLSCPGRAGTGGALGVAGSGMTDSGTVLAMAGATERRDPTRAPLAGLAH